MAKIADVVIKVITKDLDTANTKLKKVKGSTDDVTKSTKGFSAFTKAGVVGAAIAGIALLTNTLKTATLESVKFADNIGKTADKLGLTTDELQRFRIHAVAAGLTIQEFDDSYQRFLRRTGEVKRGTGELKKAFDDLGITLKTDDGQIKSNSQLYTEFTQKIKGVTDHTIQMSLAFKAFDIAGAKYLLMIRQSEEETKALNAAIKSYGLILDSHLIRRYEEAATKLGVFEQAHKVAMASALAGTEDLAIAWNEQIQITTRFYALLYKRATGKLTLEDQLNDALVVWNELDSSSAVFAHNQAARDIETARANEKVLNIKDQIAKRDKDSESRAKRIADLKQKDIDGFAKLAEAKEQDALFTKEIAKQADNIHKTNLGYIDDERAKIADHTNFLIQKETVRIDALGVSEGQAVALKSLALDDIKQNAFLQLEEITKKEKEEKEKQNDEYLTLQSSLVAEAATIKAAGMDSEMTGIRSLNDYKQQIAFEEIANLSIHEDQMQQLRDQYIDNRVASEAQAVARIAEANVVEQARLDKQNKTSLDRAVEYYSDLGAIIEDSTVGWADSTAAGMIHMARTGEDVWKNMANSIIDDIGRIIIKQQLLNAISGVQNWWNSDTTGGSNGASSDPTSTALGGTSFNTNARGGIVSSFTRSGNNVAGEAGPEAIIPLKRDKDGNLGVGSSGGSGQTNVNIKVINNTEAQVRTETSTVGGEKQINFIIEQAIGGLVQNGRMDKLMTPYGLTRNGVR